MAGERFVEWLACGQAAAMLGVSSAMVREMAETWGLTVHRTRGQHRRFVRSQVVALADKWTLGSVTKTETANVKV